MIIPGEDDIPPLDREPHPLIMRVEGVGPLLQDETAGRVNPGAAGLRQASGLVDALHGQGAEMLRDLFQQVRSHG